MHLYKRRTAYVGLLGAAVPAVESLADIAAFAGGEFSVFALTNIDEPEETRVNPTELEQRIKALEAENAELKSRANGTDAAKIAELEAALKALRAEKDQLAADKSATEQAYAADKQKTRAAELAARVDALVADGKQLPQDKPRALAFAVALDQAPGELEFSAGAGKKPLAAHFLEFLGALPANGLSGEFAAGKPRSDAPAINYSEIMNKV
jgi:hypothetical protein